MKMVMAELESQNFTFRGVGKTKAEAIKALRGALRAHARFYPLAHRGLAPYWYRDLVHPPDKWEDCVTLLDLLPGLGYRDHDEISRV